MLAQVRDGAADIGFIEAPADLRGLASTVLARDEIVVVVAAGHRWARRRSLRPAELLTDPFVSREEGSGTRQVATTRCAAPAWSSTPALQAASSQSLKRMVAEGGFTLLSRRTIEAEEAAGTLRSVPVAGVDLARDLRAVHRRRPAPAAARAPAVALAPGARSGGLNRYAGGAVDARSTSAGATRTRARARALGRPSTAAASRPAAAVATSDRPQSTLVSCGRDHARDRMVVVAGDRQVARDLQPTRRRRRVDAARDRVREAEHRRRARVARQQRRGRLGGLLHRMARVHDGRLHAERRALLGDDALGRPVRRGGPARA